jgi:hypothetical protein
MLTLIHTGVVNIALPNFEEVLLKKSLSKICLEKLCNPQSISYKLFLLQVFPLKISFCMLKYTINKEKHKIRGQSWPPPG